MLKFINSITHKALTFTIVTSFFIFIYVINIYAQEEKTLVHSPELVLQSEIDYQKIKPNEIGQIMILMYHGLDRDKASAPYMRTISGFKEDLKKLYENGYRIISLEDLLDNNIKVEAGYTPIVLTFDDAMNTAFSFEEKDGKLVPAKDCAVDIINKFCDEHPDFGKGGVFYINGDEAPCFGVNGTLKERLEYLINNGYEIGNHTYHHYHMGSLSAEKIQEEMAKLENKVQENIPGYKMISMAYPYGERPQKGLQKFSIKGNYKDTNYSYRVGIREGQSGASANPVHINFDPLNVPRVRGTNSSNMDLGWFIKYYNNQPEMRYISDGNPNRISIPSNLISNLDTEKLNDKELVIYDLEDNKESK